MMTNLKKVFISSKNIRLVFMPAPGGLFYSRFLWQEEFPIRQKSPWQNHAYSAKDENTISPRCHLASSAKDALLRYCVHPVYHYIPATSRVPHVAGYSENQMKPLFPFAAPSVVHLTACVPTFLSLRSLCKCTRRAIANQISCNNAQRQLSRFSIGKAAPFLSPHLRFMSAVHFLIYYSTLKKVSSIYFQKICFRRIYFLSPFPINGTSKKSSGFFRIR